MPWVPPSRAVHAWSPTGLTLPHWAPCSALSSRPLPRFYVQSGESWFSRWLPVKKRTEAYLPDDKNKSVSPEGGVSAGLSACGAAAGTAAEPVTEVSGLGLGAAAC